MRKFLLSIFALLLTTVTFAQTTETFDFTGDEAYGMKLLSGSTQEYNPDPYVCTEGNVTLTLNGDTRWWSASPNELRLYQSKSTSSSFTISVPNEYVITTIAISGDDGFTVSGSYENGTWTGSANSVAFTTTGGRQDVNSIAVTYEAAPSTYVAPPTISGETTFEGSTDVTITGVEGSTIYYTLDGSDPTTASTSGASPVTFTLDESATVKAIAVLNGNQSEVATKEFTKIEFTDMTIADLHKLSASQTNINLSINDGKVVYIDGNDVYVRDGENAMLFYRTDIPFTENATVSGTVKADFDIFRGLPEVKDNDFTNTSALTITDSEEEALPRNATIAEIVTDGKYMCDLVKISGIKITSEKYATDGTNQILLYGADDVIEDYVGKDTECNLTAVVKKYNNAQLLPVSIEISSSIDNVTVDEELDENAPVYNLAGQRVSKDAKGIVIQNGKKYIRR